MNCPRCSVFCCVSSMFITSDGMIQTHGRHSDWCLVYVLYQIGKTLVDLEAFPGADSDVNSFELWRSRMDLRNLLKIYLQGFVTILTCRACAHTRLSKPLCCISYWEHLCVKQVSFDQLFSCSQSQTHSFGYHEICKRCCVCSFLSAFNYLPSLFLDRIG